MTGCQWHRNQMMRTVLIWVRKRGGGGEQPTKKPPPKPFHIILVSFAWAGGPLILYKCRLAAQQYLGPDMPIGTGKRYRVWQESGAESDNCSAATYPQGYLTSLALGLGGWGGGPSSGKGSALKLVPAWGSGMRYLCTLALWSSCRGGCACQEGKSPTGYAARMVLNCALWLCISVILLQFSPYYWNRVRGERFEVWWDQRHKRTQLDGYT